MAEETGDSRLVKSEREFVGAFQLPGDGLPVIVGASRGANPELNLPVDFRIEEKFAGVYPRLVTEADEIAAAARRYRENPGLFRHLIPAPDHELFTGGMPAALYQGTYDDALRLTEMRRDLILVDGRFMVTLDSTVSEGPHEYEWRLHGDRQTMHLGDGRFVVDYGSARLLFQSLLPVASHAIDPTVLETEVLFRPHRSRPQQRGFHVALKSRRECNHRFLVAYGIPPPAGPRIFRQDRRARHRRAFGRTRFVHHPDQSGWQTVGVFRLYFSGRIRGNVSANQSAIQDWQ